MNTTDEKGPLFLRFQMLLAQARFLTFSALLHMLLIFLGGSVVLFKHYTEPPDFVAESGSLLAPDTAAQPPPEAPAPVSEVAPAQLAAPAMSAPTIDTLTTTAPAGTFKIASAVAPPAIGKSLDAMSEKAAEMGRGKMTAGPGAKGGTMVKFFGVEAKATSVVFVVDISGSMVMGKKNVASYEVLERELVKVIKDLDPRDLFGIVAFSRDAETYKPQLVRASSEEKERAVGWLKRMSPEVFANPRAKEEKKAMHKGTRADLGLAKAFELKPAAIFFVSDGEPSGTTPALILQQVRDAQPEPEPEKRTTIHAIAYLADSGQKFMKELAAENGGTFREVNPGEAK